MKKKIFLINVAFILFFFFLILFYLWVYIFPSVREVNTLKREIKEYTLKIDNAEKEKIIFIEGDKKENHLFAECDSEFTDRLKKWKNEKITFENVLKNNGDKTGVRSLKISSESDVSVQALPLSRLGISRNKMKLDFLAGLRYGAEFIRILPFSGQYLLINRISALRSGAYYHFNINAIHLYKGTVIKNIEMSRNAKKGNIIDMNSPLLKRPVYLSPLKIRDGIK